MLAFFAKSNEKWFCEIVDDPWWFLDVLWCVLICFPLIFKGFMGFRWFLGAAGPLVGVVLVAFVFPVFCGGFVMTPPVLWGGGNRYVEGEPRTFGYLMLYDALGYPYYRLFNVL